MSDNKKCDVIDCRYGCGKKIFWNPAIKNMKVKFIEADTGFLHDFKRCSELLNDQGSEKLIKK